MDQEILNALDEIVNANFEQIEQNRKPPRRRSSILKNVRSSDEMFLEDQVTRKSFGLKRRVSFADKFQVMELCTGNVYDVPGKNRSFSDSDIKKDSPSPTDYEFAKTLLQKDHTPVKERLVTSYFSHQEETNFLNVSRKHKQNSDDDDGPEKKKIIVSSEFGYISSYALHTDIGNKLSICENENILTSYSENNNSVQNTIEPPKSPESISGSSKNLISSSFVKEIQSPSFLNVLKEKKMIQLYDISLSNVPLDEKENVFIDAKNKSIYIASGKKLNLQNKDVETLPKISSSNLAIHNPMENEASSKKNVLNSSLSSRTTELQVKSQMSKNLEGTCYTSPMDVTCIENYQFSHNDENNVRNLLNIQNVLETEDNYAEKHNSNKTCIINNSMEITCIPSDISSSDKLLKHAQQSSYMDITRNDYENEKFYKPGESNDDGTMQLNKTKLCMEDMEMTIYKPACSPSTANIPFTVSQPDKTQCFSSDMEFTCVGTLSNLPEFDRYVDINSTSSNVNLVASNENVQIENTFVNTSIQNVVGNFESGFKNLICPSNREFSNLDILGGSKTQMSENTSNRLSKSIKSNVPCFIFSTNTNKQTLSSKDSEVLVKKQPFCGNLNKNGSSKENQYKENCSYVQNRLSQSNDDLNKNTKYFSADLMEITCKSGMDKSNTHHNLETQRTIFTADMDLTCNMEEAINSSGIYNESSLNAHHNINKSVKPKSYNSCHDDVQVVGSNIKTDENLFKNQHTEGDLQVMRKSKAEPGITYAIKSLKAMHCSKPNEHKGFVFPELFYSLKKQMVPKISNSCLKLQLSRDLQDAIRKSSSFNYLEEHSFIAEIPTSKTGCLNSDSVLQKNNSEIETFRGDSTAISPKGILSLHNESQDEMLCLVSSSILENSFLKSDTNTANSDIPVFLSVSTTMGLVPECFEANIVTPETYVISEKKFKNKNSDINIIEKSEIILKRNIETEIPDIPTDPETDIPKDPEKEVTETCDNTEDDDEDIKCYLLRQKFIEAQSKDCKWKLRDVNKNHVIFDIHQRSFARYRIYVPRDENEGISVELLKENNPLNVLTYLFILARLPNGDILYPFSPENIISKLPLFVDVAIEADEFMRDVWCSGIGHGYEIDNSVDPPRHSVNFWCDEPFSKFSLTFPINLEKYPNEKIVPQFKHLKFEEICPDEILEIVNKVEPGKRYMSRMAESVRDFLNCRN